MTGKQGTAEWLRDKAQNIRSTKSFGCKEFMAIEFGESCDGSRCADCYADMFERIADRIDAERALPEGMEWPRFEDGELVNVGDEVEYKGETMRVYLATLDADGWALWCSREGVDGRLSGSFGERVKRPAPKVLDADGEEIRKGDVLYSVETGDCVTVGSIELGNPWFATTDGALEHCDKFAHQRPVLDADGVPIEVGDTVWATYNGCKHIVMAVCSDGSLHPEITTDDGCMVDYEEGGWDFAKKVTHEQPDSWERLEEDAAKRVCEYAGAHKSIADDDKYSCINCPYDEPGPHTDKGCHERMRLDLVRRAKKLAGIEDGGSK